MPIYEYKCNECESSFEYLVIGGKGPENCPECKGDQFKREMSACGFMSKGPGGVTTATSASAASSCSGCTTSSCAGCG